MTGTEQIKKRNKERKTDNITFNILCQVALTVCAVRVKSVTGFFLTATALFPKLVSEQPATLMKARSR